jgi:hypothetical protein
MRGLFDPMTAMAPGVVRCDAESGLFSAMIGHRVAIMLDLWVCALVDRFHETNRFQTLGPHP